MKFSKNRVLRRTVPVAATAALALLIGHAALASNSVSGTVGGYGTGAVSGATVQRVSYTFSGDGTTITGATLTLQGDQTGNVVSAGFNSAALTNCTTGTYSAATGTTAATCTGFAQSVAGAGTLAVAVHQ